MARSLLGYWQLGISGAQFETGATESVYFEPCGVLLDWRHSSQTCNDVNTKVPPGQQMLAKCDGL
jgi:hypothetical protein